MPFRSVDECFPGQHGVKALDVALEAYGIQSIDRLGLNTSSHAGYLQKANVMNSR